ncbi:MAG: tripartite tricarboxylate transporter substrate binding protein [Steroidobacteraceae bacterium]
MRGSIRNAVLGVALLAMTAGVSAAPAKYPHKVVTLVTHSSPGAGGDVFLREMARVLPKYIDATFVVKNIPGGSGARAIAFVATSKPDGQTMYGTTPTYVYTSLMSSPPKTYKDLDPIVNVFMDPEVAYTRAEGPFKTMKDLIDHAKTKRSGWGAANPASLERQAAEQLKAATKVNAAVVSHEGGGEMMINVLNGTLDMGVGEYQELRAQLAAGKVRVLATFNPQRIPKFPDVPTLKELGYNVALEKFRGFAAPKGLPPDVIKIWETAIPLALADPDFKKVYDAEALIPSFIPHSEYGAFTERFAQNAAAFLKSSGVIK